MIANKYALRELLGAGGMGEVWTAENLATGAEVAVKFLSSRADAPNGVARFRHEARATAQLAHRCIVRVFDLVDLPGTSGSLAMVMERLRGRTLAERLRMDGELTLDATMNAVLPILHALHYAHGMGIIHRDLKPENVFLHAEPDGAIVPKLIDFGIAKVLRPATPPITVVGEVLGTPSHMSPEQARGGDVDARSDVFCAGILLHSCLTGRSPFERVGAPVSMHCILVTNPVRPAQIPRALWRVIARALEERPEDRYASAADLAEAIVRALPRRTCDGTMRSTLAPVASRRRALRGTARQRWGAAALAATIMVLSVASSSRPWEARASALPNHDAGGRAHRAGPQTVVSFVDVLSARHVVRVVPASTSAPPARQSAAAAAPGETREASAPPGDPYLVRDPGF